MGEVNIYIETAWKGPAKRKMTGAWLVEYMLKTGQPVTRGGILYADCATENEMALMLIRKAFSILTKPCCIRVFTSCAHVLNTMQNHWIWQWQKNNWRNAKDKEVANTDLWRACAMLIEHHITEWTGETHSYQNCMIARIRREAAGGYDNVTQSDKETGSYIEIPVPEWNTEVRTEVRT